jgi:hypothetical protein
MISVDENFRETLDRLVDTDTIGLRNAAYDLLNALEDIRDNVHMAIAIQATGISLAPVDDILGRIGMGYEE